MSCTFNSYRRKANAFTTSVVTRLAIPDSQHRWPAVILCDKTSSRPIPTHVIMPTASRVKIHVDGLRLRCDSFQYGKEFWRDTRLQSVIDDPVCMAWHRAGRAAVENHLALDALRFQLEEKVARADRLKAIAAEQRG